MNKFKALWADVIEEGKVVTKVKLLSKDDLPPGEVLIKVHYSGVNYKDALAATNSKNGVIRSYPIVPGIDLSGEVVESTTEDYSVGEKVIVTSYGLGINHLGGFSEYARVPKEWVVKLPQGLSLKEAMIIGTAGFTAGQSVQALEKNGLEKAMLPVLVRGATGGVGSMAVQILSKLGYPVEAESRKKAEQQDYLVAIGADKVIHPDESHLEKRKPLSKQRWQAVIDPVGGEYLSDYLAQLASNGGVALSGNAGGIKFEATVLPFILRGIDIYGINSVDFNLTERIALWNRLATDMKPEQLERMIDHQVTLEELPKSFAKIMAGEMKGRTLVKIV
ncbi:acrylyl-CoA reductase family protein [Carnobacterium pleistocenium]|uniref:acrylyl-CoA reductase family protein n=1 Tax=Carnobacterium pleistocenium TaxID=181073 RepID=UPI0005558BB8|nr:acryloyl-CoA reductase [Carnobacterium pleistocenium]